jgi:hypothetical protein
MRHPDIPCALLARVSVGVCVCVPDLRRKRLGKGHRLAHHLGGNAQRPGEQRLRPTDEPPHVTHKSVQEPSTLCAFDTRERRLCGVCHGKDVTCATARMEQRGAAR